MRYNGLVEFYEQTIEHALNTGRVSKRMLGYEDENITLHDKDLESED